MGNRLKRFLADFVLAVPFVLILSLAWDWSLATVVVYFIVSVPFVALGRRGGVMFLKYIRMSHR